MLEPLKFYSAKFIIGESKFKNLMVSGATFFDKSLFIQEIINDAALVKLIIRPPKFGKSLNMNMLNSFFSNLSNENEKEYFKDLKISSARVTRNIQGQEDEVSAMEHFGRYPVISLSFRNLKSDSYDDFLDYLREIIFQAYYSYVHVLSEFAKNEQSEMKFIENILDKKSSVLDIQISLRKLTEFLYKIYKRRVIVLIDDYDVPICSLEIENERNKITKTVFKFMSQALKDNGYLMQAVITGVLAFAEIDSTVSLNNMIVYSHFSNAYCNHFGFLENEIKENIKDLTEDEVSQIKEWYGGYRLGSNNLINPWSFIQLYERRNSDKKLIFNNYWSDTIENYRVLSLLRNNFSENQHIFFDLLENKSVQEEISERFSFADNNISKSEFWGFLVCNGYLSKSILNIYDHKITYNIRIPNKELLKFYKESLDAIIFNAIQSIITEVRNKLGMHDKLLTLTGDLQENNKAIIHVKNEDDTQQQLINLTEDGIKIIEELEQKIYITNRTIAILLKPHLKNIKSFYLQCLNMKTKISSSAFSLAMTPTMLSSSRDTFISNKTKFNLQQSPVEKLPEVWNLPSRNKHFIGRNELLERMKFQFNSNVSESLILSVHGLGGIGKTQLALEYAWRNFESYKGVCWFNVETKEQLITNYINLGQELHIFDEVNKSLAAESKARRVKTWLENKAPCGWLLILDNLIRYEEVADLLPAKGGRILITSRHTEWPGWCLVVDVFTFTEAREYAEKIIGSEKLAGENDNLYNLIENLGRLPLTLAQAFAYIKKNNKTIGQYITVYESSRVALLEKSLLPSGDKHEPVAVTWNITLKRMHEECPESVEILYCCSHLYHHAIPVGLIRYFFKDTKALTVDDAQRIAKEYSMIAINGQKETFTIHNLVQQVIRDQLTEENKDIHYLLKGIEALSRLYPYGPEHEQMVDLALKKELKLHFEEVLKYLDKYGERLILLDSEEAKQSILKVQTKLFLEVLIYLADACAALGDAKNQKMLLERVLEKQEAYYGQKHVEVARTLNNLAAAYGELGEAWKQKELLERALEIEEAHYNSKEHIEVASTLNNFANAYAALGNPEEQKILLERALKIKEAHYGKEHILVARTLNNLANAYAALGNPEEQKILLERALKIKEAYYGKEHVAIAITLGNLGTAYGASGDYSKKKVLLEQALKIQEAYYGKEHVEVAKTLGKLGNAYGALGDAKEEKALLEQALKIEEAHYGKEHSEVAVTLFNLGIAFLQQENLNEAKGFVQKAYDIFVKSPNCGMNHPYTKKAQIVLDEINQKLSVPQEENFSGNLFKGIFGRSVSMQINNSLEEVVKKYILGGISQATLEKGLRTASICNNIEDLDVIIKAGCHINAQDNNQQSKKTALHWAIIKQAKGSIKKLLDSGAQFDIKDANGKTAYDYAKALDNPEILELFPRLRPIPAAISQPFSFSMSHLYAGRDIHASQTTNIIQPRLPLEKLPELWHVPPQNTRFTGRKELLEKMVLQLSQKNMPHVVIAAHGLGGVGKTQLTAEFVWQHYKEYQGVCWFNAENREALVSDYIALGRELNLFADEQKNHAKEDLAKRVKTWLEDSRRAGWLLVYDNALKQDEISNLLPVKEGKILITSRNNYWPKCSAIAVGLFSEAEGLEYIQKVIGDTKCILEDAKQLIEKLGRLPLAISQACAYIARNDISIADYLSLYHQRHQALLAEQLLPKDEYQKAVAITWNVTLEQMQQDSAGSVELLYCSAYLHHDHIPLNLIPNLIVDDPKEAEAIFKANTARRIAEEYSMIQIDKTRKTFSMHSLVHQVTQDQVMRGQRARVYLERSRRAILDAYPYGKDQMSDYVLKTLLKPHLEEALLHIDKYLHQLNLSKNVNEEQYVRNLQKDSLLDLLIRLADAHEDLGEATKQKILLERALTIMETNFGKESIGVADILNNLANASASLGNAHEQKVLLERSLTITEAHCGKESIKVAGVLANLANAYGDLGDNPKKKIMLERMLKMQEVYYGKGQEHVELARTLGNLANVYGDLGDPHEQKALLERTLSIMEKHYGEKHIEIARTLGNLANAYGDLGNPSKKKALLERTLAIYEFFYGIKHAEVAKTLNNLSNAYGDLGDIKGQQSLLQRSLEIVEYNYGKDHIEVAKLLTNLSSVLNDVSERVKYLERSLIILEKYYGKDHIETTVTLSNLGLAYGCLGNIQKSKEYLDRSLIIAEKYYGKNHFEVAKILTNLGTTYRVLGNVRKSIEILERALAIKENHYGKDHYEIASTLNDLSNAYGDLYPETRENTENQEKLLRRALAIKEKRCGMDNIKLASTLMNLAIVCGKLDRIEESKKLHEKSLKIKKAFYRGDHPEIAIGTHNLSSVYQYLNDFKREELLLLQALEMKQKCYGENHPQIAETLYSLGKNGLIQGNFSIAKAHADKSHNIFVKSPDYGIDHPRTKVAKELLDKIYQNLAVPQEENFSGNLFKGMFSKPAVNLDNNPLREAIIKYNLSDGSQANLEKGLRMAATNNQAEDIIIFINAGININAQDGGTNKRTALHWAVEKKAERCIKKLLELGAQYNIPDASGKTAYDYAKALDNPEILELSSRSRPTP